MRDQWNSKLGFMLAAIGSAVGLGNIWRFPYIAAQNGGGSFLIPYFFAILTAGIPILILEYTIGKTWRGGAPVALARINRKFEWLGWVQAMVAFMISVYYFAIVVWVLVYLGGSFTLAWEGDTSGYLYGTVLGLTGSPFELGGIQTQLILPFLIAWAAAALVLYRGIQKGIELACKICMPLLLVLMTIIVIRGITLPGAADGLEYFFKPDWSALADPNAWVQAYGQVFFSLSICFAIMIGYSSYLPKETDVVNTAFITATTNHGFEIFAGIGVFSIIGHMALAQGVPVDDVANAGVNLAFLVFPEAILTLPGMNSFFGVLFFASLLVAGFTSLISILQAVISSIQDKFTASHTKSVTIVLVPAFIISFLFITGAGLYLLDIFDAFANNIGVAGAGLLEVILITWFYDPEKIRLEANAHSNFAVGKWWTWSLKVVTVAALGFTFILNFYDYLTHGYGVGEGGYTYGQQFACGWAPFILFVVIAVILTGLKGREGYKDLQQVAMKEVE
ncbi:MAG: sodium-dependent transporter [Bacillota bacterium]|nr:sodium-dependent transporter [Bacillota bacterium]